MTRLEIFAAATYVGAGLALGVFGAVLALKLLDDCISWLFKRARPKARSKNPTEEAE